MPTQEQTAMQILRDKLQVVVNELEGVKPETDQYGYRAAMQNVVNDIDCQMLKIEKTHMDREFSKGYVQGYNDGVDP